MSIISSDLPIRRLNSPNALIICCKCKQGHKTLYRLTDTEGKKTEDYVCEEDKLYGLPEIGNSSRYYFKYA